MQQYSSMVNNDTDQFDAAAIPSAMRELDHWLVWRHEVRDPFKPQGPGNKPTKVPYISKEAIAGRLKKAASNKPETWSTFELALQAKTTNESITGIGFCLSAEDGLTGIDLDHCFEAGILLPWAHEIVDQFNGTYIEESPSGDGLHIWCRGKAVQTGRKGISAARGVQEALEIYDHTSARYFTVTGRQFQAGALTEMQTQLSWLHDRYVGAATDEEASTDQPKDNFEPVDLEEIRRALKYMPSDEYSTWIQIGMALKAAGSSPSVWKEWSSKSEKYDVSVITKKWDSFKGEGITLATLFHLAKKHGFQTSNKFLGWGEMKPLMRKLPEAQPFPMEALGKILCAAAGEMASVIQAPDAICAQSVLAAATLAVQGHGDVEIDGRISPISEFFVSIGESGERKTAADKVALKAHYDYQKTLYEKHRQDELEYSNTMAAYEKIRATVLKEQSKTLNVDALSAAIEEVGALPEPPLNPKLISEEPTYEGLVKLLQTNLGTLGIFSNEGGRFLGGHAMNDENKLKTAAGLCGLWDGTPIDRTRSLDGSSLLYGRRVSMHLGLQPKIANLMLADPLLIEQGLMSRILITCPQSTIGLRKYKSVDLNVSPAIIDYYARLTEILQTPLPVGDGERNQLDPKKISLGCQAKRLWTAFHDEVEAKLGRGSEYETIRGFANKAPEHALRLAAVLALVDDLDREDVAAVYISRAIELVRHYLSESLRLAYLGLTDPQIAEAAKLLDWLKASAKEEVSLPEIYQRGPSSLREAKPARATMQVLVDHNYASQLKGAKQKELYILHPALYQGLA